MASDRVLFGVDKHGRKICLGRFTLKACVVFWVIFLLLSLLFALLIIFLYFLPSGIARTYQSGLQLSTMRVAQVTFYPDRANHVLLILEGKTIHPKPYWGYQGQLHTWAFLDKSNRAVFNSQPIVETEVTTENDSIRVFKSEMHIQLTNATNATINEILNELIYASEVPSTNASLHKIEFTGRFGLGATYIYQNLQFSKPIQELHRALIASASTKLTQREFDFSQIQLNRAHLEMTETGIHLSVNHTTTDFREKFQLPNGTYPVFSKSTPVMLLNTPDDIRVQQNTQNGTIHVNFDFMRDFDESGKVLFEALNSVGRPGQLALKGPAVEPNVPSTPEKLRAMSSLKTLEMPKFLDPIGTLLTCLQNGKYEVRSFAVEKNRMYLGVQVHFYEFAEQIGQITMEFGIKFKVIADNEKLLDGAITRATIQAHNKNPYLFFQLLLIFPQEATEIESTAHLMDALLATSDTDVNLRIQGIQFFPIQPAGTKLQCVWCSTLFSKVDIPLCFSSHCFKLKFLNALADRKHAVSPPVNVELPSLKLANRNGTSVIEFQTTMDMRWLRLPLRLIQLPEATSLVMMYRNQDLVKIVLPKGFHWRACEKQRAFISLELHVRNDPEVQPLFEELLDIFIHERLTDDLLDFTELRLGDGNCTIQSFRSHVWWIPPKQIYTFFKEWTQWDWSKAQLPSLLTLVAMHIHVVDGHHFLVSGEVELNAPFPVTLDFDSVSFEIAVSDFETFQLALPSFKINQGETTVKFDQVFITTQSKEPLHSKLLSLWQSQMVLNPTTSTLSNIKLAWERNSTFSLDSFSQFYYTFGADAFQSLWKKLDLFKVERMLEKLEVLNIHPLDIKETNEGQFVMNLEIDTTLNKDFSLDIPFISFDYVVQGVKRGAFGIGMARTPNEMGEKIKLKIVFDIAREPFEEVEVCTTEIKNNASICLWKLTIAESKLAKPDASSTPVILQDTLFTKDFAFLHPFLQAHLTKKQFRKLAPLFLFEIPIYDLPEHKILSAGVKLEENAVTLDFEMEIPPSSLDIEGFQADTYLASSGHDVLKLFVEALDVVKEEAKTAFRLHFEMTFLALPWITNPKTLTKRNVNQNALISDHTLLDSVFSSAWSLKFEGYQGSEEMLAYLSHLKEMPQLNAFQLSDLKQFALNFLELESKYENMNPDLSTLLLPQPLNQSITISSGSIKVLGETQNSVQVNVLSAFRFDPAHAPPFPVHVTIETSKADVLLDGLPLGVLELSSKFECRHCFENRMQANFSHAFMNHEESKERLGDIINTMINGSFPSGNISLLNFRSQFESAPSKTLFNLFKLSIPFETLTKWVLQMLPARPTKPDDTEKEIEDKEEEDGEADSVDSYSKLDFNDDKLGVEANSTLLTLVEVRSMVLFIDIDDNFRLGISIPWLTWNGKSFNQSRIEFSFQQLTGAEFSLEKLTRNFTMSQWIIGDSSSFPTQRTHLDLFSNVKLGSSAFEPYLHVFETIRTFKWHELRLEDNKTTNNAYLRTTFNYAQEKTLPSMLLPNFQVQLAVSTFASLRINTYHLPSSPVHPQQMQIELYSELAQSHLNLMYSEVRMRKVQMYGFLLRIVQWTNPNSGQSQSLENLILYIDEELSNTIINQFFDHTTELFTHPSPYNATDEVPVPPDVDLDRSIEGKAWYHLRLRTPAFFNLHINVGLIKIGFQNTVDDMDYTFSVQFANISAVTTTHGFYLRMALLVRSGKKNPLIQDKVSGWNIPSIVYGTSPDHIHVLNWPLISLESKLALSFAKAFQEPYEKLMDFMATYLGNSLSVQRLDVNFLDRTRTKYIRVGAEFNPVRQDQTAFHQQKGMHHVQIWGRDMTLMMNQKHVALHAFSLDTNAMITMNAEFELPSAEVLQNIVGRLLQFYVPEHSAGELARIVIDEVRFSSPTPLPMEIEFMMPVNYFDFAPVLPTKDTMIWNEGFISITRTHELTVAFSLKRTNTSQQLSVKANSLSLSTIMMLDTEQSPMLELRKFSVDSEITGEFRFSPGIIDFKKMSNLLHFPGSLQFQSLTIDAGSAFQKLVTPPIHFGDFNPFVLPSFYTINGVSKTTGSILSMKKGLWGALVPYYKMTFRHHRTTRTVEGGLSLSPFSTELCIQNNLPQYIGQSLHDLRDIFVEHIVIGVSSSLNVPLRNLKLVINPNSTVGLPEWRRIPLENRLRCDIRSERGNIAVKGPSALRSV